MLLTKLTNNAFQGTFKIIIIIIIIITIIITHSLGMEPITLSL